MLQHIIIYFGIGLQTQFFLSYSVIVFPLQLSPELLKNSPNAFGSSPNIK